MSKYLYIHHHATLFGTMFGGNEIWTTGFALGVNGGGDEGTAPSVAEAQAVFEAFKTMWIGTANGFNVNFKLQGCKIAHVNTEGTSDVSLTQFYNAPTDVAGGYTSNTNPAQITAAATLQTLTTRGRGSKGRMFLPGVGFEVGTDGKLAVTQATTLANVMKTFLDTVNASTAVPGVVILNSAEVAGVPYKAPLATKVASVKVGTVLDTQRSRRNKLVEQYSSATLA